MKQYTTPEQTAKLVELGFAPNTRIKEVQVVHSEIHVDHDCYFAIDDLIEMLPMEDRAGERSMVYDGLEWVVNWDNYDGTINQVVAAELIDALYDMVVNLKEKGVI